MIELDKNELEKQSPEQHSTVVETTILSIIGREQTIVVTMVKNAPFALDSDDVHISLN